nr:immunoglobulin light chain junction region [Macaca mulatta]
DYFCCSYTTSSAVLF